MAKSGLAWRVWGTLIGLALGVSVVGQAQELSTAQPMLKELAGDALDQKKPKGERLEAIRALGQWGTSQVTPPLITLLDDPDPIIRAEAARGLGFEGNQAAVKALLARLTSKAEDPAVQTAAAESLGQIGAVEARDPLLALIADPNPALRLAAMEALAFGPLGSGGDPVPAMIALLKDEAQPLATRGRAAQGLGNAKDPRGFQALLDTLERGPKAELVPFTFDPKNRAQVFAARSRILADVRAWSAQSLGQLGDPRALPALVAASKDPDDYFLRLRAVQAIVMLKSPAGVPIFLLALQDPFPPVRYAAIQGLAVTKAPSAVDPLISLLTEQDTRLRLLAVAALGEIGDPKAREPLERLAAGDPDPQIRAVAQEAVARLGSPQ